MATGHSMLARRLAAVLLVAAIVGAVTLSVMQFFDAFRSTVPVTLTADGRADPLFAGMPETFEAFVGHKEAVRHLPAHATLLAASPSCPVQAFRVGTNVYATQFHPELDVAGISNRIRAYADYGYFAAGELDATLAAVRRAPVTHPSRMLRTFVDRYAR